TITTRCRRIRSPRHFPGRTGALRRLARPALFTRTDTLARQQWPEHRNGRINGGTAHPHPRARAPVVWTAPDTQEAGVAVAAVAGCRQTRILVAAGGTLAEDQASSSLGAVVTPGVKASQPALRRRPRRWTDR